MKTKLNKKAMDGLAFADAGQYQVRDTEQRNFFVTVGKQTKTFYTQVDVFIDGRRKTRKVKLGTYPEMTAEEARAAARAEQVEIKKKPEPTTPADEYRPVTLGQAWAHLRERLALQVEEGEMSARTVEHYDTCFANCFELQDHTLAGLSDDPAPLVRAFDGLRRRKQQSSALALAVFVGRVYRYAAKARLDKHLPAYIPTDALEAEIKALRKKERQRREGTIERKIGRKAMSREDLAQWWAQLHGPRVSGVMRAFHKLNALLGCRQTQLKLLRWDDIDFDAGTIHFREVKGGEGRAYTVPMTDAVREVLREAREAGDLRDRTAARTWVFPAHPSKSRKAADGHRPSPHITGWNLPRDVLGWQASDLRRTFRTLAPQAGVSRDMIKFFMNHTSGDVTDIYDSPEQRDPEFVRGELQKWNDYLLGAV